MHEPNAATARPAYLATTAAMLPVLPPLAALIEIVVVFGALLLADWLHPSIELSDIRPHPFWIPVLLLSMQYGTVSGLIAAAVAIALTVSTGFPEQGTSETYYAYLLKIWIEPILWIGAAVLIGQFRMRQIARKQELITQVAELSSQRAAIADYARNLKSHCSALERQLSARHDADPLLVLQAVELAREDALPSGTATLEARFANVIGLVLPGARATLYTTDASGLRLACAVGAAIENHPQAWIAPAEPLYRTVVDEGRSVSVATREGEQSLGGAGMAAVPVFAVAEQAPRRVIGMLKLEALTPSALADPLLPALGAIARTFAPTLENRLGGRSPTAPAAVVNLAPLTSPQKIWRHLRWLRGRAPVTVEAAATSQPRIVAPVTR